MTTFCVVVCYLSRGRCCLQDCLAWTPTCPDSPSLRRSPFPWREPEPSSSIRSLSTKGTSTTPEQVNLKGCRSDSPSAQLHGQYQVDIKTNEPPSAGRKPSHSTHSGSRHRRMTRAGRRPTGSLFNEMCPSVSEVANYQVTRLPGYLTWTRRW